MSLWEYKVITSGVHGFATPALLEAHLNALGKDEWEIIHFQTQPNNPLAFTGLARRSTQRDWVPPAATFAAPQSHAPESNHKPHAAEQAAESHADPAGHENAAEHPPADTQKSESPKSKSPKPDAPKSDTSNLKSEPPAAAASGASLRTVRDTTRDLDPDAQDEDDSGDERDEWDDLELDEDLPTFFDALKPHFRNNQKGPGQSVAVDFLVKRWELPEADIVGALKECGLTIPETDDAAPEYFEFEDDLYWVNRTPRGQLFINTREKPRPIFRTVTATPLSPDDPAYAELAAEHAAEKARIEKRNTDRAAQQAAAAESAAAKQQDGAAAQPKDAQSAPAANASEAAVSAEPEVQHNKPEISSESAALLTRIRALMRRNRHGPGYSGSVGFLARALKITDAELIDALAKLGLPAPATTGEKPVFAEIQNALYWLNKDNRGNIWINGRENKNGARKPAAPSARQQPSEQPATAAPATETPAASESTSTSSAETPAPGTEQTPASPAQQQLKLPVSESAGTAKNPEDDNGAPSSKAGDSDPASSEISKQASEIPPDSNAAALSAVRLLLKPNKRGTGVSGEVGNLARALDKSETDFVATLTNAGLVVPPDAETKPTFVEHAGEIFWFSHFAKDGSIWLNAKPAKKKTTRPPRSRKSKEPQSNES